MAVGGWKAGPANGAQAPARNLCMNAGPTTTAQAQAWTGRRNAARRAAIVAAVLNSKCSRHRLILSEVVRCLAAADGVFSLAKPLKKGRGPTYSSRARFLQ